MVNVYNVYCKFPVCRPVARIEFGEVRDSPKVDFLDLTPLNPPTKTPFVAHFVAKSGHFGRFGTPPPLATGLPV